jgi:cell division transport system permease protein
VIKSGWINFWRQGGLSLATCFILVTAVFLIGFLISMKNITDYAISDLQNRVNISVYFQQNASEADILNLKNQIAQIPEVKTVEYVSKDQALAAFTQKHQDDTALLESINELGVNPLLASLSIKSWQVDQFQKISDFLTGMQQSNLIEKVDYYQRKPLIERFGAIASGIKTGGIVAGIILSLLAVLITFNTVRLAILNQKDEIAIQRLVGASNWFIRGPFLVQGIMAGLISSLISFGLFFAICWLLSPKIMELFSDLNLFRLLVANLWVLLGIQIAAGIFLGVFSSLLAVRKYLRV